MQKFLNDNPVESFIDLEDPQNESLLSPNPIDKYLHTLSNTYIEFDRKAMLQVKPKLVQCLKEGHIDYFCNKIEDKILSNTLPFYSRRLA